jgi:hypothetical protein
MTTRTHPADGGVSPDLFDDITIGRPKNACVNYDECGNEVPHNGQMCGGCLTKLRRRDRINGAVPSHH